MKKGIQIMNQIKQKKCICHRTSFYSIFDMSSSIKSEIPNQVNLLFFLTNSGQKSLIMFISSCFNNYSIGF